METRKCSNAPTSNPSATESPPTAGTIAVLQLLIRPVSRRIVSRNFRRFQLQSWRGESHNFDRH